MDSIVNEQSILPPINIDDILEQENIHNKTESWNKLNKTMKILKLHDFSETFGKEHKYNKEKIKQLKSFFTDMLERKKLQKTKDVVYNKITKSITEVPGLFFHPANRVFTLRADKTRPSTLKSLGPTKGGKKKIYIENEDEEKSPKSTEKIEN
jgi:hypothetical protein